MNRLRRLSATLLLLASTSSCRDYLVRGDILRKADDWSITLEAVTNGPNAVPAGSNTSIVPQSGQRFIWAWMVIRNDARSARLFGYDTCDMDLDGTLVLPSVVGRLVGVVERMEVYQPGEWSSRRLIYSFPPDRLPTRLKCADMVFDLTGGRSPALRVAQR